jgi:hypothetical protein
MSNQIQYTASAGFQQENIQEAVLCTGNWRHLKWHSPVKGPFFLCLCSCMTQYRVCGLASITCLVTQKQDAWCCIFFLADHHPPLVPGPVILRWHLS